MWILRDRRSLMTLGALLALGCGDSAVPTGAGDSADATTRHADAATDARSPSARDAASRTHDAGEGAAIDETCARIDARPRPKATAVWFVVNPVLLDGLLATNDGALETTNREMLQQLLFAADGVVPELEDTIQFGWSTLSVTTSGSFGGVDCPTGPFLPAAHDNRAAMEQALAEAPFLGGTSWAALARIEQLIDGRSEPTQDTILIIEDAFGDSSCELFTDGLQLQRQAVESIAAKGARVSVVSLLYADRQASDPVRAHAEARARATQLSAIGHGRAFASDRVDEIRAAIEQSVHQAVSCELHLKGKVADGLECEGAVLLNGRAIPCNDPDGYRLVDDHTLELTGDACESLRAEAKATVSATFPCDAFVALI
jgi:hypothetical protein